MLQALRAEVEAGVGVAAQAGECERSVGDAMSAFSGINIYDIYADVCVPARAVSSAGALLRALGRRDDASRELRHHGHHSKSSGASLVPQPLIILPICVC